MSFQNFFSKTNPQPWVVGQLWRYNFHFVFLKSWNDPFIHLSFYHFSILERLTVFNDGVTHSKWDFGSCLHLWSLPPRKMTAVRTTVTWVHSLFFSSVRFSEESLFRSSCATPHFPSLEYQWQVWIWHWKKVFLPFRMEVVSFRFLTWFGSYTLFPHTFFYTLSLAEIGIDWTAGAGAWWCIRQKISDISDWLLCMSINWQTS